MAFVEKAKKAALWFAKTYWFYIGLAIFVVIARFAPNFARHGGLIRAEYTIGYGAVAVIFLGSGLSMGTKQLMANMANWRAHTVVLVLQFLITPAIIVLSDDGGVERGDDAAGRRKRAFDTERGVYWQYAGSLYYAGAVPDVFQGSMGIRQPGKRLVYYTCLQRRDAADRVQRVCADVCGAGGAKPVPEADQMVSHHVPVQQGGLFHAFASDVFVVFDGILPARIHGSKPRVYHLGVFLQRWDLHAVHGDLLCCVAADFPEKIARACGTGWCVCLVPQNCGSVLLRPPRHGGRDAVWSGENGCIGGVAGVGTVRRQERVPGTAAGAAGAVPERAGALCGLPDPVHEDVDPCRGQRQGG
ncbi:hypothetical protein KL938_004784 [Ogataea parapolymorpha]|nr:hypothetical protein KL938_004784 [Ogataea parapolymorpha]